MERFLDPLQRHKKILFIRQGERTFFTTDLEILKSITSVRDFDNYPPSLSKFFPLIKEIIQCDAVYIWFMGRHAIVPLLFAKCLGKKVILVAGGWDVANCPEIHYGLMRPGIFASLMKLLFRLPDRILCTSESNKQDAVQNAFISPGRINVIYLGFKQPEIRSQKKENLIITIGGVNQDNLKRKGLENFVKLAAFFSESSFILIGKWDSSNAIEYLKKINPGNVKFTGAISDQELSGYLSRAKIYVQLSYHEAFGAAVAEAMLHECIPVVSNRYSLPEVVGDAGYVTSYDNMDQAKSVLQKALQDTDSGKKARERIQQRFSLESRKQQIQTILSPIL